MAACLLVVGVCNKRAYIVGASVYYPIIVLVLAKEMRDVNIYVHGSKIYIYMYICI